MRQPLADRPRGRADHGRDVVALHQDDPVIHVHAASGHEDQVKRAQLRRRYCVTRAPATTRVNAAESALFRSLEELERATAPPRAVAATMPTCVPSVAVENQTCVEIRPSKVRDRKNPHPRPSPTRNL